MSIESQRGELERTFADRPEIEIVGWFEESKSAKSPGRPIFGSMLERIDRGDAAGIIAWAPDRLARNSIDGGRIVYLLDCQILQDLKFATCGFENSSQGKFMLQIMFGQSKYYSDALSENVKRGNRTKIARGWRPNNAPLGYLNDPVTKTIIKDPVYFPFVRKMFDLMLSGAYSPRDIALIARDQWGFRTPVRRKFGGTPLAMSSIYKMLSNPFYAGQIVWDGQIYPGRHEPVVSPAQFERVRLLLNKPTRGRGQRYTFAFTGLIRCRSCGRHITAEHKKNAYGYRYVYYHCSKQRLGPRCPEPSVEVRALEAQIEVFLSQLTVPENVAEWFLVRLDKDQAAVRAEEEARRELLERARKDAHAQMEELVGLRLRNLLTDEQFVSRRKDLQFEQAKLADATARPNAVQSIELFESLILFRNQAVNWFRVGDERAKRLILKTVASNFFLSNKILSIYAAKPFLALPKTIPCLRQLPAVEDVRTKRSKSPPVKQQKRAVRGLYRTIKNTMSDEAEVSSLLANIKRIQQMVADQEEEQKAA